ncbi:hypothetical protein PIB30_043195 [Stylosanthes scabra]|uniref:Uncharacterized protein n=1 Tax=Stylosanthes scabra TaxID=79078 RepID=A0ABU6WF66_9FABA|nr:hypothetical protein [Stylosanthes scabra]
MAGRRNVTKRSGFPKRSGYQLRGGFQPRRSYSTRNSLSSFHLPHSPTSKPNCSPFHKKHHHFETFPQPSFLATPSQPSLSHQPLNPTLRPSIKPMARKTAVPHHLRHGAPSEPGSPTPPSSRGNHHHRSNTEPEPSSPPASRGKRPIQNEESPPPQPQRSEILLDRYKIAEALGYHETGICVFTSGKWDKQLGVDYLVAVKTICENFVECVNLSPTHKALRVVNAQLLHIINHYLLPHIGSYQRVTFLDTLVLYALLNRIPISFAYLMMRHMFECVKSERNTALPYVLFLTKIFALFKVPFNQAHSQEVNSYLKRGGAAKKQATRGKNHAETSDPPRPPFGRRSSTSRKIEKIVKAMKEMMREITTLVELMIRFSKDRLSQETSDQKDLAETKQLLQMTNQDLLELEEETYMSDTEDAEETARDEEEEDEEED